MRPNLTLPLVATALLLASGTRAQTWSATDVNGVQHDLQTYLDNGVTVLVDVSAHWCSPCWVWHQGGVMEELYHDFGPDGTGDLMIFYADGPSYSSMTNLTVGGTSTPGGPVQGNWLTDTPYPIIGPNGQGNSIATTYGTTAYPTLYRHCPGSTNGVTMNRAALETFYSNWRTQCPAPFQNGANDATIRSSTEFCHGDNAVARLHNMGSAPLTSAVLTLKTGGNVVETVNWTGNLNSYQTTNVSFPNTALQGWNDYEMEVSLPNGQADANPAGNTEAVKMGAFSTPNATLDFRTDNYASESSWSLFDASGTALYTSQTMANNSLTSTEWDLTSGECYRLRVNDSFGDGFCCGYGNGYASVKNTTTGEEYFRVDQFGTVKDVWFQAVTSVGIAEGPMAQDLSIFPNPSEGLFNISFDLTTSSTVEISVMNMIGEVVAQRTEGFGAGEQLTILDLGNLANGTYFVSLLGDGMTATRKVVITR